MCTDNTELLEFLDNYETWIIPLCCAVPENKWLEEVNSEDAIIFPAGSILLLETRIPHMGLQCIRLAYVS